MSQKQKNSKIYLYEAICLGIRGYRLWWKKYPMMFCSSIAYAVVGALTPYVSIYLTAQIINEIAGERDSSILLQLIFITLFSALFLALLNAGVTRWKNYEYAGQWHKRDKFYTEKLLSMDFCSIDNPHIHQLTAQIKQNEDWFGWGLGRLLKSFESFLNALVTIVGAVVLSFSLFTCNVPQSAGRLTVLNHPLFIILIVAAMLSVTLIVPMLTNKANSYWANFADDVKMCTQYESYFSKLVQNLSLALDMRTYRQDMISEKYYNDSVRLADRSKTTLAPMRLFHSASTAVGHIVTVIIYLFVCLKAWGGAFGVGSVTQYISAVTSMSRGVSGLLRFFGDQQNNAPFLKSVFAFLDTPNTMRYGDLSVKQFPEDKYEIEFCNVSFKYPSSEKYALKNLSLRLTSGQRLAVVGQNGSGKTTFIKLLCRMYDPTEGEICLNGIDIRKYDYQQYINIFSVVFQDFNLLAYGLGQNVSAAAKYDATKVRDCLIRAGFGECLKDLPKGASVPDIALLPNIAIFFGVTIDELFQIPNEAEFERIENLVVQERQISQEKFTHYKKFLEDIIEKEPRNMRAYLCLAYLYNHRARGDHEIAGEYARKVLELDPDEKGGWVAYLEARGGVCGDEWYDNHFEVIEFFKDFLGKNPGNYRGLYAIIENLLDDGRYDEAIPYIEQMKTVARTQQYEVYMGDVMLGKGHLEKALEYWDAAVEHYPERWQAFCDRADRLKKLGRFEEALADYETCFIMQEPPRLTDGLHSMAQVHEQLGDFDGAIQDRKRIIKCLREEYHTFSGEAIDEQKREIERLKKRKAYS